MMNHAIPKTAKIPVIKFAQTDILSCPPETSVADAAALMRARQCSSILVVEDGRPLGIWTEHDALRIDLANPAEFDTTIATVMSGPLTTIAATADAGEAVLLLQQQRIRHLLIVDAAGVPVGIASQTDLAMRHGVDHFLRLRTLGESCSVDLLHLSGKLTVDEVARHMVAAGRDAAVIDGPDGTYGILTERDLLDMIACRRVQTTACEAASFPLRTAPAGQSLLEGRRQLAAGQIRHLGITNADGILVGLLSLRDIMELLERNYATDLTETLRERDEQLLQSRHDLVLAASVFTHAREGIMITNLDGHIVNVNAAFTQITGYTRAEVIGQSPSLLGSGKQGPEFYEKMWRKLGANGYWSGEIWNRRKDGEVYVEFLTISAVPDASGHVQHYVAFFSDITAQKVNLQKLERIAHHDALTGLPNRILLADRMHIAMAHSQRSGEALAVCVLDLDNFKPVNDTLGHAAGDRTLQEIARRMQEEVRAEDTVARLGGDEFVLLLGAIHSRQHCSEILQRLLAAISKPIAISGHAVKVSASIGVALFPDDASNAEKIMHHADQAMYAAKAQGKNCYAFYGNTERSALSGNPPT